MVRLLGQSLVIRVSKGLSVALRLLARSRVTLTVQKSLVTMARAIVSTDLSLIRPGTSSMDGVGLHVFQFLYVHP